MKNLIHKTDSFQLMPNRLVYDGQKEQLRSQESADVLRPQVAAKLKALIDKGLKFTDASMKSFNSKDVNPQAALDLLASLEEKFDLVKTLKSPKYADIFKNEEQRKYLQDAEAFWNPIDVQNTWSMSRSMINKNLWMEISSLENMKVICDAVVDLKDVKINSTNIPFLRDVEIKKLFAAGPTRETTEWVKANKMRCDHINSLMGNEVALLAGKKSQAWNEMTIFTADNALFFRNLEPAEALRQLDILQDVTVKRAEARDRERAEAELDKAQASWPPANQSEGKK